MPSSLQAADYSAALQYLNAVKAAGSDDADKVLAQMQQEPRSTTSSPRAAASATTAAWSTTCT